jgi:hypothetical protein
MSMKTMEAYEAARKVSIPAIGGNVPVPLFAAWHKR